MIYSHKDMRFLKQHWPILCVLIVGGMLRIITPDWDAGGRLHPDEALIVNGALSVRFFSNLFPGFHDYNGFSVYLLRLASLIVSFVTHTPWWTETPEGMTILGRYISAVLSTFSIFLVYLVGKRMWNARIGTLAALMFTAIPLHIQLSHFYTTECMLVWLFLVLLYGALQYDETPDLHSLIRMAIASGLLLATKNTAYLFLPIPLLTIVMNRKWTGRTIQALAIFAGLCVTVFFLASPYSFIDFLGYVQRSAYLHDVVSGKLLMDWTIQFQDTRAAFWLPNIFKSFGPVVLLGAVGTMGTILQKNMRRKTILLFALWGVGFYCFLSMTYLKFIRYSAPLLPIAALFGAKFLFDMHHTRIGKIALLSFVCIQVAAGCMYFSIYTSPHTSIGASQWIGKNIPTQSTILTEEWNSIIRFNRPELAGKNYNLRTFNFYTLPDDDAKMHTLSSITSVSDYIILESPKVKNTVIRLSTRYPKTSRWYTDLEAENLGYRKIMTFTSYPRIGPFTFPDDTMEETFTVFDHPTITIYKRTGVCAPGIACRQ